MVSIEAGWLSRAVEVSKVRDSDGRWALSAIEVLGEKLPAA
jgi:hypothetical protein